MSTRRRPLDEIDVQLLDLLQADADQTLRELGDQVGLSPSAVQRRITSYKSAGLLRTVAVVSAEHAPALTQALVVLSLVEESLDHHRRIADRLRARPEVQQCYALSGRWDYAVLLTATSVRALRDLSDELFKSDDNIRRYDTMFLMDTVKSGATLPSAFLLP
ncbi:DNA-binding transcriptional regulator, Lrp family [Saccharopolyspora kobensis]|uniref:DNA-binding transcriptional regulator, Lrp family n=1 Tax=Saccharopolyspora kobensis TaxID=146035 RepID=A0A1H6E7C4_9PSEU|nr:Lrp/AsnC family transcriptional regulator [Saccharopolyspora kobensis]SEG93161.1 DNA-binding transcriptional regulator, Lrp family [Saccharopolyspora kobensis]SFD43180.1 transcriptional regulator, AsnC family [Saccharopolyspora kobensis]